MQGLILDEFRQFVVGRLGFKTWESVVQKTGHDLAFCYSLALPYPDDELGALSAATAQVARIPPTNLLEAFGEWMVPDMMQLYSNLLDPKWRFEDFLLHMEPLLVDALRLHAPTASQLKIRARRLDAGAVQVVYESDLKACAAVEGVMRGAAHEYGVGVDIAHEVCALRGDRICRFFVLVDAPARTASNSPRSHAMATPFV